MRTTLQVTTPPTKSPVTVAQARAHCRIDHASDDELLAGYIQAATTMAEGYLSRALLTQTLLWTVRPTARAWPEQSRLRQPLDLPRAPVQSIVSVSVLDDLGNTTTLAPAATPVAPSAPFTGYIADLALEPGRLRVGPDTILGDGRPLRQTPLEYVQISMIAGYAAPEDIPASIVLAINMIVAFLYEQRGDAGGEMPEAARWLLDRDRLQFLAAG